ncbi:MAG: hypothetical protein A3J69_02555 [Candidatus Levybacteria bacterium RIFCSPHIGHO2_02_FULL_42_12]|nr:MAG: hypothetical protein A2698_00130 [Candidatus Levybacteria bacterium RIFCSPHIGHO2_01_FULL_42_15]OGH33835.1 MAG: hypothetical protein A3J69_02555 [Candidatus Levybacteria bacterium RIFCSPHIGHO2_02_FULL_42_12]
MTSYPTASLKQQAIETALTGDWTSAIKYNKEILKENPDDIDTLNRLAFAFTVARKIREAKKTYQRVLELDRKNPIATKNLKRLQGLPSGGNKSNSAPEHISTLSSLMFLEESGKTKIVELINTAEPKKIALLLIGEPLGLRMKRFKVFVLNQKNQYVGMLPDNIARRLIALLKGGNMYEIYIKSINNNRVSIFLKETKRANRFKNQSSFAITD